MTGDLPDDDPLLEGLPSLPRGSLRAPEPPAGLFERVHEKTRAVIRARRRRRRFVAALCLVAAYAAGLATPWRLPGDEPARPRVDDSPTAGTLTRATADPGEILRQVIDTPPAERARLLRAAGDAYLSARGDVESALDCYRQVLELSGASSKLEAEPGDTWLLASLKAAHRSDWR
jgi:hypothetical protein